MGVFLKISNIISKAEITALNRAAKSAITAPSSAIREIYNIKKKDLENNITIDKANSKNNSIRITIKETPLSLAYFNPRQTQQGVTVAIKKGERKLRRNEPNKGSFLWIDQNSITRCVFIRTGEKKIMSKGRHEGKKREVIKKLYGITAMELFSTSKSLGIMKDKFDSEFTKNFDHEIQYRWGESSKGTTS
jgi:hypothetical protein